MGLRLTHFMETVVKQKNFDDIHIDKNIIGG